MQTAIKAMKEGVRKALPAVAMLGLFSVCAMAQYGAGGGYGTISTGAETFVQMVRYVVGIVGVVIIIVGAFSLVRSITMGLSAIAGGVLFLIIAGNARTIVDMFYSTTG